MRRTVPVTRLADTLGSRAASAAAVLACVLALGGCFDDSPKPRTASGDGQPADPAPRKMSALKVTGIAEAASTPSAAAATAASTSGASSGSNRQSINVAGGASAVQTQGGAGNVQTLNVQASGGVISQSQSGTGNVQTMNVGTVDGVTPKP
jgi:hypothetical protein